MDAPTCPLCGKKEWRHICNPKAEAKGDIRAITVPSPKPKLEANNVSGFDRTKYQREYMRRKRAEQKKV